MGQIAADFAMKLAIERAETHGIAAVAVRGSNHCGALAYFAMQALARDMIGWATTNALPTMAPWGGAERLLGINPLGIAVPAGEGYGTELGDMARGPSPGQDGHFFMAIRVEAFEDVGRFKTRVDAAIREIHASRLAPGFEAVYAPGEIEFLNEERNRREGVPL